MKGVGVVRKPSREVISTAYHEAGHAVMAVWFHIPVQRVSIVPDNESLGHVQHSGLPKRTREALKLGKATPHQRQQAEYHIMVCYAGGVAEKRYRGRHNYHGSRTDSRNATDLAQQLCHSDKEVEAFLNWLYVRTIDLINRELWPQIDLVVQVLLEKRTISGKELYQTIIESYSL